MYTTYINTSLIQKILKKVKDRNRKLIIIFFIIILILSICINTLYFVQSDNIIHSEKQQTINANIKYLENLTDNDSVELCLERQIENCLLLEVAKSNQKKTEGLMFYEDMRENYGMFFVFDTSAIQSFWMKNTYIPLDIIFLNESLTIINIENATEINQTNKIYSSTAPSKFVIEVNYGVADHLKLKPGDNFKLKKIFINTKIL